MNTTIATTIALALATASIAACSAAPLEADGTTDQAATMNALPPPMPAGCDYQVLISGFQTDIYCSASNQAGTYVLQSLEGGVWSKQWKDYSEAVFGGGGCGFTLGYEGGATSFRLCSTSHGFVNGVYQQLRTCTAPLPAGPSPSTCVSTGGGSLGGSSSGGGTTVFACGSPIACTQ